MPSHMICTLKAGADKEEFEAKTWQSPILQVKNEVLVAEKALPLCLLAAGDFVWGLARTGHHSQYSQDEQSLAMHPHDWC